MIIASNSNSIRLYIVNRGSFIILKLLNYISLFHIRLIIVYCLCIRVLYNGRH